MIIKTSKTRNEGIYSYTPSANASPQHFRVSLTRRDQLPSENHAGPPVSLRAAMCWPARFIINHIPTGSLSRDKASQRVYIIRGREASSGVYTFVRRLLLRRAYTPLLLLVTLWLYETTAGMLSFSGCIYMRSRARMHARNCFLWSCPRAFGNLHFTDSSWPERKACSVYKRSTTVWLFLFYGFMQGLV